MTGQASPEQVRIEMRKAMAKYLAAKKTFLDVHAEYVRDGRWADPDYMAKKDARVKTAMGDEAFYGAEVRMFAAYLAVERDATVPVPDVDRGHIPLSALPLTGGTGDGYPVGTRGEAAGQ